MDSSREGAEEEGRGEWSEGAVVEMERTILSTEIVSIFMTEGNRVCFMGTRGKRGRKKKRGREREQTHHNVIIICRYKQYPLSLIHVQLKSIQYIHNIYYYYCEY